MAPEPEKESQGILLLSATVMEGPEHSGCRLRLYREHRSSKVSKSF